MSRQLFLNFLAKFVPLQEPLKVEALRVSVVMSVESYVKIAFEIRLF